MSICSVLKKPEVILIAVGLIVCQLIDNLSVEYSIVTLMYFSVLMLISDVLKKYIFKKQSIDNIFLVIIIVFTVGVLNAPIYIPTFELSKGNKTLVLQGMRHQGAEFFYNEVHNDALEYRKNGYVVFHEGIGASGEITNDYDVEDSCDLEDNTKVIHQPYCLGLKLKGDYYADVNFDVYKEEMTNVLMESYEIISEEKANEVINKKFVRISKQGEVESESISSSFLENFRTQITHVIIYINQGLIPTTGFAKDDIVLTLRNEKFIEILKDSGANKLYSQYGASHAVGIIDMLEKEGWELNSTYYKRVM